MKAFVSPDRIDFLDERFYSEDGIEWVPSVTHILDAYPKGVGYTTWLKSVGDNAAKIAEEAAAKGSITHNAIDMLNRGEVLAWDDAKYSLEVWQWILMYKDFWDSNDVEIIETERSMASTKLGYGGTLDLISKINGETWLIDFKTSNAVYNSYDLQLAAYRRLYEELSGEKIDRMGIFWFKSLKKGPDKTGKNIQGKGWEIKEVKDYNYLLELFDATHMLWKRENPNAKPKNLVLPTEIKL